MMRNARMEAKVEAVWDDTLGCWQVHVWQKEVSVDFLTDEYRETRMQEGQYKVRSCDEFVLAAALQEANGIDPESDVTEVWARGWK